MLRGKAPVILDSDTNADDEGRARILYPEDPTHGQEFDGVRVVNPIL